MPLRMSQGVKPLPNYAYSISVMGSHAQQGERIVTGMVIASCEQIAFWQFENEMEGKGWALGRPAQMSRAELLTRNDINEEN
jgi:hypothetical protein